MKVLLTDEKKFLLRAEIKITLFITWWSIGAYNIMCFRDVFVYVNCDHSGIPPLLGVGRREST